MANRESVPASDRLAGFESRLRMHDIALDPSLVVENSHPLNDGYNEQGGYAGMKALLSAPEPPDAVFATSDAQAVGALEALKESGKTVGVDVHLVGYDDLPLARYVGLTTLRQPMNDIGGRAFELLMNRMSGTANGTVHTVFSPTLIQRQSTRALAEGTVGEGIAL